MKQSSELFTEGLKGKSQAISQKQVLAAYKQVKSKGGAGGVDGLNFQEFESRRNDHLYKLWNRLASGSYFPQAVRQKRIPKYDGTWRRLGIPTISDRTASGQRHLGAKIGESLSFEQLWLPPGQGRTPSAGPSPTE